MTAVALGVHHAEVVAHRVGEPFGTLVLALAITVIELGLIGSIMASGGAGASTLARDTLFATVMIICNGVVGLCLLVGAVRHHTLAFRAEGATHALAALAPLVTLTLVLPLFTTTTAGPTYSPSQLTFAGVASLSLYAVFVFAQTVRHRDYFLPVLAEAEDEHAPPPADRVAMTSMILLVVCLVAVVGLAKQLAPVIESGVRAVSAPPTTVGVVIALIILLPESVAALRAAARNRMNEPQPGAGLRARHHRTHDSLRGGARRTARTAAGAGTRARADRALTLTMLLSAITLAGGRATIVHGTVHLVVFGAFLVLALVP